MESNLHALVVTVEFGGAAHAAFRELTEARRQTAAARQILGFAGARHPASRQELDYELALCEAVERLAEERFAAARRREPSLVA